MNEKQFRNKVIEILAPIGARPVENILDVGMPDVVCVAGWIELKVSSRPKRSTSRIPVIWQPGQQPWLKKWRQHGGRAWTLLLLDETWILHDAFWSVEYLGEVDEDFLIKHASGCWPKAPTFQQLAEKLLKQITVN